MLTVDVVSETGVGCASASHDRAGYIPADAPNEGMTGSLGRRTFLGGIGAAIVATAGCLGSEDETGDGSDSMSGDGSGDGSPDSGRGESEDDGMADESGDDGMDSDGDGSSVCHDR